MLFFAFREAHLNKLPAIRSIVHHLVDQTYRQLNKMPWEPPEDAPELIEIPRRLPMQQVHLQPFDANGCCIHHPQIVMAKQRKKGGWRIRLEQCPKCCEHNNSLSHGYNKLHSDETESLTSEDSRWKQQERHRRRPSSRSVKSTQRQRSGRRELNDSQRSGGGTRSLSRSSRHGGQRRDRHTSPSSSSEAHNKKKHTQRKQACIDGKPFDKLGRCFNHPHVKLASKRMLGGWKIHMNVCPLCVEEEEYDVSVISGMSKLTIDNDDELSCGYMSSHSKRSRVSRCSSRKSTRSMKSGRSMRSMGSSRNTRRSKRRVKKDDDDSFLPLDENGFCIHHPDVQLAKVSKKGGWKVLLDACPSCSECNESDSDDVSLDERDLPLPPRRKISQTSDNVSCKSGRSSCTTSTFIESMPYIDDDGNAGHYTGQVDSGSGQPNGRGKMKYITGERFEGVWYEGTKLQGQTSKKTSHSSRRGPSPRTRRPSPPPPLAASKKRISRRSLKNRHIEDTTREESHHRTSNRDRSRRGRDEESTKSASSRRSLSRLRRKCDEIETLLKEQGCPTTSRDAVHVTHSRVTKIRI